MCRYIICTAKYCKDMCAFFVSRNAVMMAMALLERAPHICMCVSECIHMYIYIGISPSIKCVLIS